MKRILFFVLILISAPLQADDWRAFEVRALPGFGVQGSGKGEIKITNNYVCFKIDKASAWVLPQLEKYKTNIVGIRFGLAYEKNGEIWDILGYAPMHTLGVMVSTDNRIVLAPFQTSMLRPKELKSKKYWVLMETVMKDDSDKGFSYSYAHEEEGLK